MALKAKSIGAIQDTLKALPADDPQAAVSTLEQLETCVQPIMEKLPLPQETPVTAVTATAKVAPNVIMLHAVANIEYHAVVLYAHTAMRFAMDVARAYATPGQPPCPHAIERAVAFALDCLDIAAEEALHFRWLDDRYAAVTGGCRFGSLPAHTGLWDDGRATCDDLLGRLAALPLVLEARALDSHERLVGKFRSWKDVESADLVGRICSEEVRHVDIGRRWFEALCGQCGGLDPVTTFHEKIRKYMGGNSLPPPFNRAARDAAGMGPEWYTPLALQPKQGSKGSHGAAGNRGKTANGSGNAGRLGTERTAHVLQ